MLNSLQGANQQDLLLLVALVALAVAGLLRWKGWLVLPNDPKPKRPAIPMPGAAQYFERLQGHTPAPAAPEPLPEPRAAATLVEQKRTAEAAIAKRRAQLEAELEILNQAAGTNAGG